ncbi:unnamed protein product [Peronospora belbahrii]|uniref:Uncharacterized protein n=1 Tax=Peronospora belbahrii TaxID=622444 RepID=A0AAU9LPZ7_9STRA|nr:unnamed protein product [Peronospora belbahrii]
MKSTGPYLMPSSSSVSLHPSSFTSSQLIDLTLDDEEDEIMERQVAQESVENKSTTISSSSNTIKLNSLDGIGNESATVVQLVQQDKETSEMTVPLVEDIESDVDEEWPHISSKVALSAALSVNDNTSHHQMRKNMGALLDVMSQTISPFHDGQKHKSVWEEIHQVEVTRQQTLALPLYEGIDDIMKVHLDEELSNKAPQANADVPSLSTIADQTGESLEDGEIFEEGVALKPMIQEYMSDHHCESIQKRQVNATGIRSHLRSRKQKKRGKKKAKRKVEAMQAMHAPPGRVNSEFKRTIRQQPFADDLPPFAMMRNGPRGEPMNMRPVFQDAPPALFCAGGLPSAVPHPPLRPPLQQRPAASLPPSYEDSQILRVNRQGGMEMIGGEAELSLLSASPITEGFQYHSLSVIPPPSMPNGPGLPLQRSVGGRDESVDFDLDSLRAAALRTKIKRSVKKMDRTTTIVTSVQSSPSSSRSVQTAAYSEEKKRKPVSPEIDELRFDILRSMKRNRNRTASSKTRSISQSTPQGIELSLIERPDESRMKKAAQSNPSGAQAASQNLSECTLISRSTDADRIGNDWPSSKIGKSLTPEQVVSKMEVSKLATTSEKTKPSTDFAVSTSEFRPLTASSQSVVIQLTPNDFLPRKSGDKFTQEATSSSGLRDAIKQMRRKIAEREQQKQTKHLLVSTATELSKQSFGPPPSSALSSPSLKNKAGGACIQWPSAPSARPGISSPCTERLIQPAAGANVDKQICAQTEANQEKEKVTKEVLSSPLEMLSSVKSAILAAGRESFSKPTLEPQLRNDISKGIMTLTIADGVVAETLCGSITERLVLNDKPVSEIGCDFDAIQAEYQQCVVECEEAEVHIARLSVEMAQLEKQLPPA